MRSGLLAGALLFSLQAQSEVALVPVELKTSEHAAQPSVTVDPREGFVVTWQERDEAVTLLKFAVIAADGGTRREGLVASGKDWFVNGADFPNLAVLDNGDWVTFWLQKTSPGTYAYAIRTVRSVDKGKTWGAPVVIHRDATDTEHGFVSMAPAKSDRVRLVWFDGRLMAGKGDDHEGAAEHMTLRTATLGRDGKLKDEHELDDLTCSCCQTDSARGARRTLFAYRDRSDKEVRDISVLTHSNAGWSQPALVHEDNWTIAGCPVNGPAVTARGERFAVLWPTMASGEMQLKLALGDGIRFGAPKQWAGGAAELGRVDLANWGVDGFLATRVRQDGAATTLVVDELGPDGAVRDSQIVASRVGGYPRLASLEGVALLVWAVAGKQSGNSQLGIARISEVLVPAAH
jgi:hypothetical protein